MIKALIFDLDGTLVDNMHFHRLAWVKFAAQKGVELSEKRYINEFQGRSNKYIMPLVFGHGFSKEELKKFAEEKESVYRSLYDKPEAIKGFWELFETAKAKGLKIAVATTAPEKNREHVLSKLDLKDKLDAVVGDEEVKQSKPDPEIYQLTAKRLDIDPQKCLVFEDSLPGITAAKAADMRVVGVTTTYTADQLNHADATVKDFSQADLSKFQ